MSYLTLNGFDERDYIGNVSWFTNFSSGWNLTVDQLRLVSKDEDEDILPGSSLENAAVTLMFQTGYPYIGVPTQTYDDISKRLSKTFPSCTHEENWGICSTTKTCD